MVGADIELALADPRNELIIGSAPYPTADLTVSSKMIHGANAAECISRRHLLVERQHNRLRITDLGSRNGLKHMSRREREVELAAGAAFEIGGITLLLMDRHLQRLRPEIAWALGFGAHREVDGALMAVGNDRAIALIGPNDCDQQALARAIHDASARRAEPFTSITSGERSEHLAMLATAGYGTVFVDLAAAGKVTAAFANALFDKRRGLRPIIAAPDAEAIARRFGTDRVCGMDAIPIPPLCARGCDVPRILDRVFQVEHQATRSVEALGARNVAAIARYTWPGNFADVRFYAPLLLAVIDHGLSVRAAARAIGRAHTTLLHHLRTLGIHFKDA